MTRLAILGEYDGAFAPHALTDAALGHASAMLGLAVDARWVSTAEVDDAVLAEASGLWIAPGSPYRDMDRTLRAIRFARERGVPCLGTCGGFQHMILEYARNVLGFPDAQHAEYDPYASRLFISRLACSLAGRDMDLHLAPGSQAARIYGATAVRERYYCNFGVNPDCVGRLKAGPLRVSGADAEGEVRVVELPGHPFFVGTLFVPQARSQPGAPHPLVAAFVRAAAGERPGIGS